MSSLNISAAPGTDIWRKPPSSNTFNAPYKTLDRKPLNSFSSAQLTATFTPTTQYDQAGLLLIFHPPATLSTPETLSHGGENKDKYWIKSGVEFYNAKPYVSTVTAAHWADWSITPHATTGAGERVDVTIVAQKSTDVHGTSIWMYKVGPDGERQALREICWVFALDGQGEVGEGGVGGEGWEVEVAAYACRPDKEVSGELGAEFRDVKLEWV
ncbi:uncharacterized protein DNG_06744 [Cephalotrichum gorgonifer]|uniref:Uncharacterized protein n=1 Tax=Cephalotrichum gorgonifer TaxID=2041049 RepID=A0AAE8N0C5_9PEZI|nr:uncharacterized protein DNG_06744 [Cephalotrichum gorgonifer]